MKYIRRAMCEQRLKIVTARRLNTLDPVKAFGLSYDRPVRVNTSRMS